MYEKEYNLINLLLNNNRYTTNAEIQRSLKISRRTVINYIKNINSTYKGLIASSEKGYLLDDKKRAISIVQKTEPIVSLEGYENRKIHILQKLVLNADIVNIDDLANELYISIYTLKKDISHLQVELKKHNLYIKTKNNNIYIIGKDKEKKKYVMDLLSKEIEEHHLDLKSLQGMFMYADIEKIHQIITACLDKHNFFIDDFSLFNYALHLAIYIETSIGSIKEIESIKHIDYSQYYSNQIQEIIYDIYETLTNEFEITLSLDQISEASILMSTRIVSKDYNQLSFNQLETILDVSTIQLVNQIVQLVHETYGINLKSDNFLVRFSFHIKNILIRSKNKIDIPTNQFITIKEDFPFLYFLAAYITSIIIKYTQSPLSEAEISYIALHLGVLMEERKNHNQNINCVIVIYDYYNLGKILFQKISNHIQNLYLLNIVSSYKQLTNYNDIDLIITTLPTDQSYGIPMINVNMIPNQSDIMKISSLVNDIKKNKKTKEIEYNIRRLFKKNLFNIKTDFNTRNEVIHSICDCMKTCGYVESDFKNTIFAREEIASSAYCNIAIPHPISANDDLIKESTISVIINNHSIEWGEDKIDYVFLLALKKEDKELFKDLFDIIIHLLLDETQIDFHNYQDYDSFINLIIKHCY